MMRCLLPRTIVLRTASSALPASHPSRKHAPRLRKSSALARKPTASPLLAKCRLVSSLLLRAVLQRIPATPSLGPWCPQPPTPMSSAKSIASQAPSLLARLSEELGHLWHLISIRPHLQLPMCL